MQSDADMYNATVNRIVKYEEQLSAIASDIKGGEKTKIFPETCADPHERAGQTGVCWCEQGYRRDSTTLKCVKQP